MLHINIYDEYRSGTLTPLYLAIHGQLAHSALVVCAMHAGHVRNDIDEGLCSAFGELLHIGQSTFASGTSSFPFPCGCW